MDLIKKLPKWRIENEHTKNKEIKASEMLVAPRISKYFLKSLKF